MARLFSLLLCWLLVWPAAVRADEITLYAYHLKPPYIIDKDKGIGLYYDLAAYLNERISNHTFKTVYLPRRRLEHDLETGHLKGLVIGVHPTWFKDDARSRYFWTPAFVHDEDVVVSNEAHPIPYVGPESLVGKSVGLSMGYYYYGVDELVTAGRIKRDDAIGEEVSLDKLVLRRIDAAIVTRRTLDYLVRHRPEWRNRFFIAKRPHDEFDRHVLVPHEYESLMPDLNAAIGPIMRDPQWQRILRSYY